MMQFQIRNLIWKLKGVKVYALIGKSGTGKSFRAKLVAQKYGIEMLIDDGLLIRNKKILAGRSAKKEAAYLGAIRTAIFDDPAHRDQILKALQKEKFKRILLIGTSEKMVKRICQRLKLPPISRLIRIEDIASEEDISTAINSRGEGNHVIPVPAIEVRRDYSQIFYDSVKVFLKKGIGAFRKRKVFEKAVVKPDFQQQESDKKGKVSISEAALSQMILHCVDEFDTSVKVKKVSVKGDGYSFRIKITADMIYGEQLSGNIHELQNYIMASIEKFTGIVIEEVDISIDKISPRGKTV